MSKKKNLKGEKNQKKKMSDKTSGRAQVSGQIVKWHFYTFAENFRRGYKFDEAAWKV